MPFKDEDGSLRDILAAIEMIEAFTSGMDFEEFRGIRKRLRQSSVSCKSLAKQPSASARTPRAAFRGSVGGTYEEWGTGCATSTTG